MGDNWTPVLSHTREETEETTFKEAPTLNSHIFPALRHLYIHSFFSLPPGTFPGLVPQTCLLHLICTWLPAFPFFISHLLFNFSPHSLIKFQFSPWSVSKLVWVQNTAPLFQGFPLGTSSPIAMPRPDGSPGPSGTREGTELSVSAALQAHETMSTKPTTCSSPQTLQYADTCVHSHPSSALFTFFHTLVPATSSPLLNTRECFYLAN